MKREYIKQTIKFAYNFHKQQQSDWKKVDGLSHSNRLWAAWTKMNPEEESLKKLFLLILRCCFKLQRVSQLSVTAGSQSRQSRLKGWTSWQIKSIFRVWSCSAETEENVTSLVSVRWNLQLYDPSWVTHSFYFIRQSLTFNLTGCCRSRTAGRVFV